jgi:hypothetical protein
VTSASWTPATVAPQARRWQGSLWRAVEAQHRVATLRLVDTLQEQAQLEALLETSMPALPAAAAPRHYLLLTPFRYPPRDPGGSRFRAATDPGVFYGAAERRTACAELGYWRWRFLMDSPALPRLAPLPHTLFQVQAAGRAIDLTRAPFKQDAATWTAPRDYGPCQRFGGVAREAGIELIRYRSVRDPEPGYCFVIFSSTALVAGPLGEQTWRLTVTRERVQWQRDSALEPEHLEFVADWQ